MGAIIDQAVLDATEKRLRKKGEKLTHSRNKKDIVIANVLPVDFSHSEFCFAQVAIDIGDEHIVASGYAKKHPEDKADVTLGLELAYARAFEGLSKKLYRRANGLVKHRDDMKIVKDTPKPTKKAQKALPSGAKKASSTKKRSGARST